MSITPLPSAPAITDTTSEFNTKAFNWVAALDTFTTEANAQAAAVDADAIAASESASDALVAASTALATVGAVKWVSGTTYAEGDAVYSPLNKQTYRRNSAGGGTTDPSLDSVNWTQVRLDPIEASQAEMEAGTESGLRSMSPLRIKQAISAQAPPENQITAIASGNLPNGAAVAINSDNTVSIVGETTESYGTSTVFKSGNTSYISAVYASTSNKVVIAYTDVGSSNYGAAIVGTVSGTSISFGTPVFFKSAASTYISAVYDSTNNKVIITFSDGSNSGYLTAIVGTVSGTTISFGSSAFTAEFGYYISSVHDSINNKIVISYLNGSSLGKTVVCTVSGTTISFGTPVSFKASNTGIISSAFDKFNNKIVIAYIDGPSPYYGYAIVGTVSGTTISFGTPVAFRSSGVSGDLSTVYEPINNRVLIAFNDSVNSYSGTVVVGTVSGTSISFGNPVVFRSGGSSPFSMVYNTNTKRVVIAYQDGVTPYYGKCVEGIISGSEINFFAPSVFKNTVVQYISIVYDSTNDKEIIAYRDNTNSGYGNAIVRTSYQTNSLRFIGFANSAVTSGQVATIKTIGSVITNQTGLSASKEYYVQTNGTLSTTQSFYSKFAGTAISSTSLIVKG